MTLQAMERRDWIGRELVTFGPDRRIEWEVGITVRAVRRLRTGEERQDLEFELQMIQDLIDDICVFDHRDDFHVCMTVGTY
jgi:hypothetical protein